MYRSKLPLFVLSVFGIVCCFLPWAETLLFGQSNTVKGLHFSEGGLILICYGLIAGLSFVKPCLPKNKAVKLCINSFFKTALIISGIIAAICLYKIYIINTNTARILAYNIDVQDIKKYHPSFGLHLSLAVALINMLYASIQLMIRHRKIMLPASWLEPTKSGRFYLPAHHNTTL